jgi:hypothetical protein
MQTDYDQFGYLSKKKKDHDQFGQFDFILVGLEFGHSETQGRINLKIKA